MSVQPVLRSYKYQKSLLLGKIIDSNLLYSNSNEKFDILVHHKWSVPMCDIVGVIN